MTEITVSTRIPKELETELETYMEKEHLEKSTAIRKLLFQSLQEWREQYALRLLEEGRTTLSKAAEMAGMDLWSFTSKVRGLQMQWVKDIVIERDLRAFA